MQQTQQYATDSDRERDDAATHDQQLSEDADVLEPHAIRDDGVQLIGFNRRRNIRGRVHTRVRPYRGCR